MIKSIFSIHLLCFLFVITSPFQLKAQEVVSFDKYTVGYINQKDSLVQLSEIQLKKFWAQYAEIDVATLNQPISIEIKWSDAQTQNLFLVKTKSYDNTQVGSLLRASEINGKTVLVFETKMDYVLGFCKTDGTCNLTFNDTGQYECFLSNAKNSAFSCKKEVLGFGKNSTILWHLYFPKE